MLRRTSAAAALALVLAAGFTVGCSDDDDPSPADDAFCEDVTALLEATTGEPTTDPAQRDALIAQLRALEASAPDEIADAVGAVVAQLDQLASTGPEGFDTTVFAEQFAAIGSYAAANCDS